MITLEISFGAFVGLGVFAGIVVLGVAGGLTIRNKLRNVSRQLFGTESIVDGLNRQADIAAETKSKINHSVWHDASDGNIVEHTLCQLIRKYGLFTNCIRSIIIMFN